jgi:hypothetical protein
MIEYPWRIEITSGGCDRCEMVDDIKFVYEKGKAGKQSPEDAIDILIYRNWRIGWMD